MMGKHLKILVLFLLCLSIYVYTYIKANNAHAREKLERELYAKKVRSLLTISARLFKVDNCKRQHSKRRNDNFTNGITDSKPKSNTNGPLLTLFTSWGASASDYARRNTTVENWVSLRPYVNPLLFTNDVVLRSTVEKKGWETLPVSKLGIDIPVLKNMYLDAKSNFKTKYYAYANGDILFTENLILTLLDMLHNYDIMNHTILTIGRRTNVKNISKKEAVNFTLLRDTLTGRGEIFTPWAIDYFITTAVFPWDEMPNVVIGRRGLDNFLVLESLKRNFCVIDATETILAIHHTTDAGNYEHFNKKNRDYNTKLISGYYQNNTVDYSKGMVSCANYYSDTLKNGTVVVRKKDPMYLQC